MDEKNEILKEVAKYTLAFVNACGRPRPTTVCVQNTDFLLLLSSNIKNLFYSPVFYKTTNSITAVLLLS